MFFMFYLFILISGKSPFKAIALDVWEVSEDLDLSGLKAVFIIHPEPIMENNSMLAKFKTVASKFSEKGVHRIRALE